MNVMGCTVPQEQAFAVPNGDLSMNAKPTLFIASSSEHLNIAYAVQQNLEHEVEATVWNQGVFEISTPNLLALANAIANFDFAVFVFSPDDVETLRDKPASRTSRPPATAQPPSFVRRKTRLMRISCHHSPRLLSAILRHSDDLCAAPGRLRVSWSVE